MIAIVEKIDEDCFFWERLLRKNSNAKEIIYKYSGFEGDLKACFDDDYIEKKGSTSSEGVKKSYSSKDSARMLIVSVLEDKTSIFADRSIFLGYEFGIFDKDSDAYSSIFHEVLFGSIAELTRFKKKLNDNGLFQTTSILNEYMKTHQQLYLNGFDVEHDDLLSPFIIHQFVL